MFFWVTFFTTNPAPLLLHLKVNPEYVRLPLGGTQQVLGKSKFSVKQNSQQQKCRLRQERLGSVQMSRTVVTFEFFFLIKVVPIVSNIETLFSVHIIFFSPHQLYPSPENIEFVIICEVLIQNKLTIVFTKESTVYTIFGFLFTLILVDGVMSGLVIGLVAGLTGLLLLLLGNHIACMFFFSAGLAKILFFCC